MHKSLLLVLSLSLGFVFNAAFAQKKLKYDKDIFPLISAKNYDQAIPMLWTFLSDSKNESHANANLQIGLYYESLVNDLHIVKDSTAILGASDTSVIFLAKAKALITEKELKKNDDFYQAFYRRDLRSGEFGIKISDVHLDLEKKLESLRNINKYAHKIYVNLYYLNAANQSSLDAYTAFTANYATENDLYLMAGEEVLNTLKVMMEKGDEIEEEFDVVRDAVSRIGKKGYSPELSFNDIESYGKDGFEEVDFFSNDVVAWNYGDWAEETSDIITGEIKKMKEQLMLTKTQLDEQHVKIKSSAGITIGDLSIAIDSDILDKVNKFDEDALPLTLLNILVKKNLYDFITNPRLNERLSEVDDVNYQLSIADSLLTMTQELEALASGLDEASIDIGSKKYTSFVKDGYDGDFGMIKYRKSLESQIQASKDRWSEKFEEIRERSRWGVSLDEMDSLYLIPRMDSTYEAHDFSKYYSIVSMEDDSANTYVVGLEFQGSKDQGFISKVNNARQILWKTNFPMKKFAYSDSALLVSGKFIPSQEGRVSAYIFSFVGDSENNLIALSTGINGELKWSNELKVKRAPIEIKFNDLVKETIFFTKTEGEIENGADDGDPGYFVIDRGGKVR